MKNLSLEERLKLASLTVKHKGDTAVVATANLEGGSWEHQLDEVKRMEETGVDGVVFITKSLGASEDVFVE